MKLFLSWKIIIIIFCSNSSTSMTSLLAHTVAQATKWRFLPKNLNQLVIFVIGLVFIKIRPNFRKKLLQKMKLSQNGFYYTLFYQSSNLKRNKNQNHKTDFWQKKMTLKIKFWWFLLTHDQVNASSITKITS